MQHFNMILFPFIDHGLLGINILTLKVPYVTIFITLITLSEAYIDLSFFTIDICIETSAHPANSRVMHVYENTSVLALNKF